MVFRPDPAAGPQALASSGDSHLDRRVRAGMLCAFDFDGTLAPIRSDPDRVRIDPAIGRRVERLAGLTPVAIVTGRSAADVAPRLGFRPRYIVGNHGFEGLPGMSPSRDDIDRCADWAGRLRTALPAHGGWTRMIVIENKGPSLSLHFRLAPDRERAEILLRKLAHELLPHVHVVGGKCVLNLLPRHDIDKGVALQRLAADCGAASTLFVGDDLSDEPAFALPRASVLGVRVGYDAASRAECYLEHRLLLAPLLDEIIGRLQRDAGAGRRHAHAA